MDLISDNGAVLILLLFGAFFVAVHAYRLYGEVRHEDIDEDIIRMGGKVGLVDLVGRRSYATGFVCYLALLELLFLILSSSSLILEMALTAVGDSRSVGALGASGADINPWAPVLASSAVIAITEVKPFLQIEQAIRRVAHGIAGIPRHLERTIERIYDAVPDLPDTAGTGVGAGVGGVGAGGLDAEEARRLASVERLRGDIAVLDGWTRDCVGSAYRFGSLHLVRDETRREVDSFDREYRQLVDAAGVPAGESSSTRPDARALLDRALEVKRRLVLCLALVIVGRDALELPRGADARLEDLAVHARGRKRSASLFNTLALSAASGFAIALGALFLGYLSAYVVADFTDENMSVLPVSDIVLIRSHEMPQYVLSAANKALSGALWDVAALASIFLAASLVAVGVMLPRIDRGAWKAWHERESAIQYLTTGALATMITYLVYLIFLFLKLVVVPSVSAGDTQRVLGLMNDFGSSYLGYSLIGLMAFPCAVLACRLFDDYLSDDPERTDEAGEAAARPATAPDRRLSPWQRMALVVGAALLCGLINLVVLLRLGVLADLPDVFGAVASPALVMACLLGACARYTVASRTAADGHGTEGRGDEGTVAAAASAASDTRTGEIVSHEGAKTPDAAADFAKDDGQDGSSPGGRGKVSASAPSALGCTILAIALPLALASPSASGDTGTGPVGCERVGTGDVDIADCRIVVGVREDARPFSYLEDTPPEEDILPGFGGYMIEVCRSVLREMIVDGPFEGVSVVPAALEAKDRFPSLQYGDIDMLCGPDSITPDRLDHYYVSHPVFLSGMTYGYVDPLSPAFPRSAHCGNIVGVVNGTTAESDGLAALDESGLLLRFDEALALELEKEALRAAYAREALVYSMKRTACYEEALWEREATKKLSRAALDRLVESTLKPSRRSELWQRHADEFRQINARIAREVVTQECPAGFSGMPVRRFLNHDDGIRAFCEGKVLYYLGDYDILTRRIREFAGCKVRMNRFTTSRELYGVFFAARERESAFEDVRPFVKRDCRADFADIDGRREGRIRPKRALLYAEFNTTLLRMIQGKTSLLEKAFDEEFGEQAKSKDLAEFFDSLKIVESER